MRFLLGEPLLYLLLSILTTVAVHVVSDCSEIKVLFLFHVGDKAVLVRREAFRDFSMGRMVDGVLVFFLPEFVGGWKVHMR